MLQKRIIITMLCIFIVHIPTNEYGDSTDGCVNFVCNNSYAADRALLSICYCRCEHLQKHHPGEKNELNVIDNKFQWYR